MKIFSTDTLKSLGLKDAQAKIYTAALELGEANIQELSNKSGVKRTSIYNFIDELKTQGFLAEIQRNKRRLFSAVDPKHLLEAERLRLRELEQVMPELLAIQNNAKTKPKVTFYEGRENVLAVYEDQLKEKKPIFTYEDLEFMQLGMPDSFYEGWPGERAKRNIPLQSIFRDSTASREKSKRNIRELRKSKFIKSETPWRTGINIYGNKVAFMRFKKNNAVCVLIEDEDIAETMRSTWQSLWQHIPEPPIG